MPRKGARSSQYRVRLGAREAQRRRTSGAIVNPEIPLPKPFCKEVGRSYCEVCGEYAAWVNFGIDKEEAALFIRQRFPNFIAPEGKLYISRGPLLWAMHVMKTEKFFERHAEHCELALEYKRFEDMDMVPIPPVVIWAQSFGSPKEQRVAQAFMEGYDDPSFLLFVGEIREPKTYTSKMNKQLDILINLRPKEQRQQLKLDLKNWKQEIIVQDEMLSDDLPF